MSDNIRFRVEAKDFELFNLLTDLTGGRAEPADNWKVVGSTYEYDNFPQAVAEAQKQGKVYRELRIVRTVETVMATYKDGAVSE